MTLKSKTKKNMSIPCLQETNIALLQKTTQDMIHKIDKIEWDVSDLKDDIWEIKLLIERWFREISDARVRWNEDIKQWAKSVFANKIVEKIVLWIGTAVWFAIIWALLRLIII